MTTNNNNEIYQIDLVHYSTPSELTDDMDRAIQARLRYITVRLLMYTYINLHTKTLTHGRFDDLFSP